MLFILPSKSSMACMAMCLKSKFLVKVFNVLSQLPTPIYLSMSFPSTGPYPQVLLHGFLFSCICVRRLCCFASVQFLGGADVKTRLDMQKYLLGEPPVKDKGAGRGQLAQLVRA